MSTRRLLPLVTATLFSFRLSAEEPAWTPRITVLKYLGENTPPEKTSIFVAGETSAFVFAIQTPAGNKAAELRFQAGWSILAPNGETMPAPDTQLRPAGRHPRDPSLVLLEPTPTMILGPSDATGAYRVQLSVTNAANGKVYSAEEPVFVFLTAGARDLVTDPQVRETIALDEVVLDRGFWGLPLDSLAAKVWPAGFAWLDLNRGGIRSSARVATFLGQRVTEAKIALQGDHPAEVSLSLYNRGDEAPIPHAEFTNRISQVIARLRALTGRPPQSVLPPAGSGASAKYKTYALVWPRETDTIRLEYAWSEVKPGGGASRGLMPEFITINLKPRAGAAAAAAVMSSKIVVPPGTLAKNVRRTPDGDVFIENVPMVDQGEKGYCAAAAGERVLEYYGGDVDQHELAQRMQMDSGGVTFENMIRGLRAIAQSLGLQVRVLMDFDDSTIEKLLADYDKMAKKMGRRPLEPPKPGRRDLYAEKSLWEMLDKEVFLASRTRDPTEIDRFMRWVQTKVDAGIPLCHCVIIGILPEEAELGQPPGAHLRLIIGYNLRTREILYTDSWGPGHERKRMPLNHAWAMTIGLFTLEPR